jgi:hypothetical protein
MMRTVWPGRVRLVLRREGTDEFLAERGVDAGSWFLHPWKLVTSCGRVALINRHTTL